MDYQVHQLQNGIRILHKPSPSNISHACIIINAGSRDEDPSKDGLAHFIEHLLFKQTEKRNTNQILNRLELVGGDLNAYTTKEYTCIHASFLKPHLERSLDLFEDIVFHSVFPEEEIKKEKEVILDEISSYQDQPEEAINDDFEDLLFDGHPLGRNILGTPLTVQGFTKKDIVDFHKANYRTDEIVIGIYGDYDLKTIIRLSEKFFAGIPANFPERTREKTGVYSAKRLVFSKPINQTHCVIGNRSYSMHHKHKTAFLLLNNLLGGTGMSSRLNLEIREKYGIAYTIESNYTPMSDIGIFSIYFGTDAEKTGKAIKLVEKELRKLREQKLGPVQLRQAKDKFIGQIALGEENRMGLLISMSKSLLDYGRVDSLEEIFAKINSVTDSQVLEIANEMFDPKELSSMIFNPKE
ncbi:MAG: peptidase M16 [Sphingobacteriales bacterium 17-39-43]|uniref:M16 family metallopeptidase n=1 Tax=Daejeonella sp. TaxID=2805397 RepID=UPI000BC5ED0E|nr:pitrilysin family protein [Daejeonella sp.]OYY02194.1 MAG: peptidase M16 [Sphingobacteriia bacterium 35-40-5]OYZ32199.1 MAG: peptidase M16 [Sphingobacteriales bacterium 16-39-50]OZA25543.1 MAG: peptidase M16 [Sphingobacteriales bacterium 17-39-43]HQS51115.1 pitrilysin family protein [Daejeonella sp.]HQT22183.1 pitrilysin family protein [Daejeonella sp.]